MANAGRAGMFAVALLLACASDDSDGMVLDDGGGTVADDDGGPCEPGSPGCSCVNGSCLSPLVCIGGSAASDGICTWPPGDDGPGDGGPSDDGPGDGTGDDGTDDDGGGPCSSKLDCLDAEVCVSGSCVFVYDSAWEIRVPHWVPTTCDGGPLDGLADLWWQLRLGGSIVAQSSWVQGGCPGSWPNTIRCVEAGRFWEPFVLYLWDEDVGDNDLMDALWWGEDQPIPWWYLHAGVFDDLTGSGGMVRVEFTPVASCD